MTLKEQINEFISSVEGLAKCVSSLPEESFLENLKKWSLRDIVAHLVGWNRYITAGSIQIMRGELPFYDDDPGENFCNVNAELIREHSTKNREKLLEELLSTADGLKQFLESLDTKDWDHDFGVRHNGQIITIKNTVDELIADYLHHTVQIKDWARKMYGIWKKKGGGA